MAVRRRAVLWTVGAAIALAAILWAIPWFARGPALDSPERSSGPSFPSEGVPTLAAKATPDAAGAKDLVGRVVDSAGEGPVAGALVEVSFGTEAGEEADPVVLRTGTGAEGQFRFAAVPDGATVVVDHPSYLAQRSAEVWDAEEGGREPMRFRLQRACSLDVSVVGDRGEPWAGGSLTVERAVGAPSHVALDEQGRARLERIAAGTLRLTAHRAEGSPDTIVASVRLQRGRDRSVRLGGSDAPRVRGRLVRGSTPVRAAWVNAQVPFVWEDRVDLRGLEVVTDADGAFTLEGAEAPREWWVRVDDFEGPPTSAEREGDTWVLRVPDTAVRVFVSDPDGLPIPGVGLSLVRREALFESDLPLTDAEGAAVWRGVLPGRYVVEVVPGPGSAHLAAAAEEVQAEEGREAVVRLRLEPAGTLRVLVVDSAGEPVRGVRVSARKDPAPPAARPGSRWVTAQDLESSYVLRGLPPGAARVVVEERGFSARTTAVVEPRRDAEVRVVLPWRPLANLRLRVTGARPLGRDDVGIRLTAFAGRQTVSNPELTTDPADAAVRSVGLFAGTWHVQVSGTGHETRHEDLLLAPGETKDLEVRLEPKAPEPDPLKDGD